MAYRISLITNRQKQVWLLVIGYWLLITLLGCSMIKEVARGFAGISTKALQDARKEAITKTFNYDYNTCYNKVRAALTEVGSYIYAQDKNKHMLAVYVSETDTTAVGVFFRGIDANNTQIEVSSQSTYAKETVAKNVFSVLEGTFKLEEMKGQTDAKKEMGHKSLY